MSRHSSLPWLALVLFLFIPLTKTMAQAVPRLPLDVVYTFAYTLGSQRVETYVVDRTTGMPALKGVTKLDLGDSPNLIVPSPDDHFIYFLD